MNGSSKITSATARLARAAVALVAVVLLLISVPLAVAKLVGWPLPASLPTYAQLHSAMRDGVDDAVWIKVFAFIVCLAWAQLVFAVAAEAVARARGRVARPRAAAAWAQHLAAWLVGSLALVTTAAGPASAAGAGSLPAAVVALRTGPAASAVAPTAPAGTRHTNHIVVRGECLSSIARDELGDASAWPRIWSANRGRSFGTRSFDDPDLILPGWQLVIPTPAMGPAIAVAPAKATAHPSASEVAAVLIPPVTVVAHPMVTPDASRPGTPVPAVDAPTTIAADASASVGLAPAGVGDDTTPVWTRLAGVLGSTLLATGLAASLGGRRRRALRRGTSAHEVAAPAPELAPLVTAVSAASGSVRVARLELALRALAGRFAQRGVGARPVAVRGDPAGAVEVVLDQEVTPENPWLLGRDGRSWVLAATVPVTALTEDARSVAPPCPALVGIGLDGDDELYVDLEALGALNLPASATAADFLRFVVATLSTTPLAEQLHVIVVGSGLPTIMESVRHRVHLVSDLAAALAEAKALTAGLAPVPSGASSTFRLRAMAGHESWEPVVVVVPPAEAAAPGPDHPSHPPDELRRLVDLAHARRAIAVIGAQLPAAEWSFGVEGLSWRVEPLGWKFRPHGLSDEELAGINRLFDAVEAEPVEPLDTVIELPTPTSSWKLMVRVLGPVDVVDRSGRPVVFERAKSLELVVWIAQHAASATRAGARSALWDLDVANASFSNVVSEARRALARSVPPPEGTDWLARTYAERLPLHPAVVLDADLLAGHLARARSLPERAAIDELRAGLALVRGAPYAGACYIWPDAEALPSTLTLLATTVASELAERCLAVGDVEGVFAATGVGLEVLPGHEELVALRMRGHASRGDEAGLRREYACYERAVLADSWAGGEPAARLVELRHELLDRKLLDRKLPVAGS